MHGCARNGVSFTCTPPQEESSRRAFADLRQDIVLLKVAVERGTVESPPPCTATITRCTRVSSGCRLSPCLCRFHCSPLPFSLSDPFVSFLVYLSPLFSRTFLVYLSSLWSCFSLQSSLSSLLLSSLFAALLSFFPLFTSTLAPAFSAHTVLVRREGRVRDSRCTRTLQPPHLKRCLVHLLHINLGAFMHHRSLSQ